MPMRITIVTLFPEMFVSPFSASILKRAQDRDLLEIRYVQIRDFAGDAYKTVDDHPYGGGTGMILKVDVVDRALTYAKSTVPDAKTTSILLDPQGVPYSQKHARSLSTYGHIILVCGHYEGIDERIRFLVDSEISLGDYVVTGGEIAAIAVVDSIGRLLPGVLKKSDATLNESFESSLLEYPQYTRPETYAGVTVPDVLLSGNHAKIQIWKDEQAKLRTSVRRPDLLKR